MLIPAVDEFLSSDSLPSFPVEETAEQIEDGFQKFYDEILMPPELPKEGENSLLPYHLDPASDDDLLCVSKFNSSIDHENIEQFFCSEQPENPNKVKQESVTEEILLQGYCFPSLYLSNDFLNEYNGTSRNYNLEMNTSNSTNNANDANANNGRKRKRRISKPASKNSSNTTLFYNERTDNNSSVSSSSNKKTNTQKKLKFQPYEKERLPVRESGFVYHFYNPTS
ncbi:hypothetical protein ABK040_009165 [Willaertia magna]